jgi:hypothetical protein
MGAKELSQLMVAVSVEAVVDRGAVRKRNSYIRCDD